MNLLILSNVHVEPNSSAAGKRMLQLVEFFLDQGYSITYATTAAQSEFALDLTFLGVVSKDVAFNDPSFDALISDLQPDVVLFDRFMTEEQFGWRVAKHCPNAIRMLDTEDLHCLRYARETAMKEGRALHDADLNRDIAYREVASIYRCDLSLMISPVEKALLQRVFSVSDQLLYYLPFLVSNDDYTSEAWKPYGDRTGFVTIGNFRHAPNLDSVVFLKRSIWPEIRKRLPDAILNVYGSYASKEVMAMTDSANGFLVHGRVEDALGAIARSKILLSPLRFGAGMKGKLLDAMLTGTPSITTSIGSEGMQGDLPWPGAVADDVQHLVDGAVKIYLDESAWKKAVQRIEPILMSVFPQEQHLLLFQRRLEKLRKSISEHRSKNTIGNMLQHHTMRSSEYMSKWIETKNR